MEYILIGWNTLHCTQCTAHFSLHCTPHTVHYNTLDYTTRHTLHTTLHTTNYVQTTHYTNYKPHSALIIFSLAHCPPSPSTAIPPDCLRWIDEKVDRNFWPRIFHLLSAATTWMNMLILFGREFLIFLQSYRATLMNMLILFVLQRARMTLGRSSTLDRSLRHEIWIQNQKKSGFKSRRNLDSKAEEIWIQNRRNLDSKSEEIRIQNKK